MIFCWVFLLSGMSESMFAMLRVSSGILIVTSFLLNLVSLHFNIVGLKISHSKVIVNRFLTFLVKNNISLRQLIYELR